jgi:hypothetical protein
MTTAQTDTETADAVAPGEEASTPAMDEPTTPDDAAAPDDAATDGATEDAPAAEPTEGGGTGSRPDLVAAMDRVSLDQALQDFAVANARVLDLTRRLTTLTEEVARLNDENAQLRIQAARLRELEASSSYQVVRAGRAGVGLVRKGLSRLRRP